MSIKEILILIFIIGLFLIGIYAIFVAVSSYIVEYNERKLYNKQIEIKNRTAIDLYMISLGARSSSGGDSFVIKYYDNTNEIRVLYIDKKELYSLSLETVKSLYNENTIKICYKKLKKIKNQKIPIKHMKKIRYIIIIINFYMSESEKPNF